MLRNFFALSIVAAMASSSFAATITGTPGDAKPSILFDLTTGIVTVAGEGTSVGLFDILSDVPIFNAVPGLLPPGGLFTTDNTVEKAWASLGGASAFSGNWVIGPVAIPNNGFGATVAEAQNYLNQHLTITWSGGFGTNNVAGDVIVSGAAIVPEPATLSMIGLALVGGLGAFRRRRS